MFKIEWNWNEEELLEGVKEEQKEIIRQQIEEGFISASDILIDILVDIAYGVALLGGGVLVLLRAAGMTRASKYFTVLQVGYILLRAMTV